MVKMKEEEIFDYEKQGETVPDLAASNGAADTVKKGYVGNHSSGLRDFLLKPELCSVVDSGFEHPSEANKSRSICVPSNFCLLIEERLRRGIIIEQLGSGERLIKPKEAQHI